MTKRKPKRVNPLLTLPYTKVYDMILNGKATSEDFEEWLDEVRCQAFETAYEQGYSDASLS